jgi:GGDEF domain-containing protein
MSLDGFVQLIFNVYEAYTVALYVKEGEDLTCLSAISFAQSFDKSRTLPVDGTLPGWSVKHHEPLVIGNFDKDEETLGYYGRSEEIKSFMAYPLETPGVIIIDSKKKWVFTDKEKKILAHFVAILKTEVEREKRLQEMEEEREELFVTRRLISLLRDSGPDVSVMDEILTEGLTISGGDLAIAGVEGKGFLHMIGVKGAGEEELRNADCPLQATIASTVLEGEREFVLPYESGYLREKPLLFPNDGIRAKQYFGFPLVVDERTYGFVGFVSVSEKRLREKSIGLLREMAMLSSLYLSRVMVQSDMGSRVDRDPVTAALRFGLFYKQMIEMTERGKGFCVISVKLTDFDRYNRAMGVDRTDDILRKVYQGIEYCAGKSAIITRSGGGQFYVAVDGTETLESKNIYKVLKFTIMKNIPDQTALGANIMQLGAAYYPQDGKDLWALLQLADKRGKQNTV